MAIICIHGPWAVSSGVSVVPLPDRKRDAVIVHFIPTETLRKALTSPIAMVGSNGSINEEWGGHPRGAGTYARLIRQYVREWRNLTLLEAMTKTSYLAALQLEQASPSFGAKAGSM